MTFLCGLFFFFPPALSSSGLNLNWFFRFLVPVISKAAGGVTCAHPFHQVLHLLMLKDRVAQSLCCPFSDWSEMISQRSFDTFCQMPVNKMRMHICICPLGCFLALPFLSSLSFLFWPLTGSFLVLVTHQLLFYPFLLLLFSIFHNHCRAQQGHKSHGVGHKETRGFHSTPHVTVKCCCWSAPKGVYGQCEGLDDHLRHLKHIKEERRGKKK